MSNITSVQSYIPCS